MFTVAVGFCSDGVNDSLFTRSLAQAILADKGKVIKEIISVEGGPLVHLHRNVITEEFLRGKADALFMVDSDMGFETNAVHRLLARARQEQTIVGGLCHSFNATTRIKTPTIYRWAGEYTEPILDFEPGSLIEVDATGAAALMIPRSILKLFPDRWVWPAPTNTHGEDILFFKRLEQEFGIKPLVDTGVVFEHAKRIFV